jgi:hypothetical protein
MLDEEITMKTSGAASSFVPNTKYLNLGVRFADGNKGDEMLDEEITMKTSGAASTFVPNTKYLGFAIGNKGDEMLDEKITLKTSGPASSFVPNTEYLNLGVRFANGNKGDEMLDEKITLKTSGPASSFVPNTEYLMESDVNPDGMDPAVHAIASSATPVNSAELNPTFGESSESAPAKNGSADKAWKVEIVSDMPAGGDKKKAGADEPSKIAK